MRYEEPVFRPPAEAQSLLVQVTIGCSHNRCTFCAMYKRKTFHVRQLEEILGDLECAASVFARHGVEVRKLFLCDGDALAAPSETLLAVCEAACRLFPRLKRISVYAGAGSILAKSEQELAELAARKLSLAYLGLESGSDPILRAVGKPHRAADVLAAAERLDRTGWQLSLITMLGLCGRTYAEQHRVETAKIIAAAAPRFLSFLTTAAVPGTPYARQIESGQIQPCSSRELLQEMQYLIAHTASARRPMIFRANHVSNQFPIEGTLPKDTARLVQLLGELIEMCPADQFPEIDPFGL